MKARIVICVIAAMFLFSSASPWEGAAAVAPEGELPATGRYVATNAFPINTIVDITNIESSKSTRAIVAKTLNSPGLLAVVSFEAAELIGMRPGSVSRIRMVQPSDPIAYLRFTEGANASIPEYDSGRVLTEEQLLDELYRSDTYRPSSGEESAQVSGTRGPSYTLEPEWSGRSIIDLPGYVDYPLPEIAQPPVGEQRPPADSVDEQQEIIKDIAERIDETPDGEVIKDVPSYIAEAIRGEAEKDINDYITEAPFSEAEKSLSDFLTETPRTDVAKDIPGYVLSPTTERPPENGTIYNIDPSVLLPEIAAARRPAVTETTFSIPRIYSLDRGRYYVQIFALDSPDQVEPAVRQIDRSYQPVVYKDGDNWYRILLGPLNQGESAAVLQRFKSIGFRDAFVRRGS